MRRLFEETTVFFLLLFASGVGVAIYARNQNGGGGLIAQSLFGALYLCIGIFLLQQFRSAWSLILSEKWMMALCALAFISFLWSVEPSETIRRSVALIGTALAGLYIGMKYEPKDQVKLIATCAAVGAILSLIVCIAAPNIGLTPHKEWQGVYFPKNSLARMMVLGVMSFTWLALRQRRRRMLHITMILFCLFMVVMADSASGIVVSAVFLLALPFRRIFALRPKQLLLVGVAALAIAVPVGLWSVAHVDDITAVLSRSPSLTGRTPLWHSVEREILERPILGFGYSAFWSNWRADQDSRVVNWAAPNAHSGFLEFTLGLGVIGLAIFLIGLLRNLWAGVQIAGASRDPDDTWPIFFLLFFAVLYNLVESTIGNPNTIFTILYVANSYWLVGRKQSPVTVKEAEEKGHRELAGRDLPGLSPAES